MVMFVARLSVSDWPKPVRAYLHESGIDAFGSSGPGTEFSAALYLGEQVLGHSAVVNGSHPEKLFEPAQYLIVALFGKDGVPMAEVFGYGDFTGWPGNPTKYRWTFRNNVYAPETVEDGCEDTDIVLGTEGKWRRSPNIRNLDEFMRSPPPYIEVLNPDSDYHVILSNSGRLMDIGKNHRHG